jgi:hypothetical protein
MMDVNLPLWRRFAATESLQKLARDLLLYECERVCNLPSILHCVNHACKEELMTANPDPRQNPDRPETNPGKNPNPQDPKRNPGQNPTPGYNPREPRRNPQPDREAEPGRNPYPGQKPNPKPNTPADPDEQWDSEPLREH